MTTTYKFPSLDGATVLLHHLLAGVVRLGVPREAEAALAGVDVEAEAGVQGGPGVVGGEPGREHAPLTGSCH